MMEKEKADAVIADLGRAKYSVWEAWEKLKGDPLRAKADDLYDDLEAMIRDLNARFIEG